MQTLGGDKIPWRGRGPLTSILPVTGAAALARSSSHHSICQQVLISSSNLGGSVINEAVLNLLKAGWSREDIKLEHLGPQLQAEIAKSTGNGLPASQKP